jgi:hypothetical protein
MGLQARHFNLPSLVVQGGGTLQHRPAPRTPAACKSLKAVSPLGPERRDARCRGLPVGAPPQA